MQQPVKYDLLIQGGRVIDPVSQTDGVRDIAFLDGKVAALDEHVSEEQARSRVNARGKIVVPGLVDLHSHIYWGSTSLGVDARAVCSQSGTTTFVDAGSAGAGNFAGFRRFIVDRTELRVLAFLNVSYAGIFGFRSDMQIGECEDLRLLDRNTCIDTVRRNRDIIVGIKVRVGRETSGASGIRPVEIAREIADELNVPIMAHVDMPPPTVHEALSLLRPGDIWTHCFKAPPNSLLSAGGMQDGILAMKRRGVLFDVGHGLGSFSFDVAREMIDRGIYPDSISSDVHAHSVSGPAFNVLHTASKLLCLGMPLQDVISRISSAPARCIGLDHIGRLSPGGVGDAVVLEEETGDFDYTDSQGQRSAGLFGRTATTLHSHD